MTEFTRFKRWQECPTKLRLWWHYKWVILLVFLPFLFITTDWARNDAIMKNLLSSEVSIRAWQVSWRAAIYALWVIFGAGVSLSILAGIIEEKQKTYFCKDCQSRLIQREVLYGHLMGNGFTAHRIEVESICPECLIKTKRVRWRDPYWDPYFEPDQNKQG